MDNEGFHMRPRENKPLVTPAQESILALIMVGKSHPQIGTALGISHNTVAAQMENIRMRIKPEFPDAKDPLIELVKQRAKDMPFDPEEAKQITLTERQAEVLKLIQDGLSDSEIAENLVVEVRSVEHHLKYLRRIFNAKTRIHLITRSTSFEASGNRYFDLYDIKNDTRNITLLQELIDGKKVQDIENQAGFAKNEPGMLIQKMTEKLYPEKSDRPSNPLCAIIAEELKKKRGLLQVKDYPHDVKLSKPEEDVAVAIGEGKTNAQIGKDLYYSHNNIESIVTKLFKKFGAKNRVQLAAFYTQYQLGQETREKENNF